MSTAEPRRPDPAAEEMAKRAPLPQSRPRRIPTPAELFARRPRPVGPAAAVGDPIDREDQDGSRLATGTC